LPLWIVASHKLLELIGMCLFIDGSFGCPLSVYATDVDGDVTPTGGEEEQRRQGR